MKQLWWRRKRARKQSDQKICKAKVEEAKDTPDKRVEFDYEETSDVLDATLEELRNTSSEGLEKMKKATKALRDLGTVRPPAPGPTEKVSV